MAKNRMVSTGFWSDYYIADLDPVEKLLFLYLLTCERSTLAGVYELPIKMMAVETGIDVFMVEKILKRFDEEGKVKYQSGWVAIRNFLKHHEHGSPTVKKGISDAIAASPEWAQGYIKGIEALTPSSSSSSSSLASVRATPVPYDEEDENTKPKSKPKYPNAKKVFTLFGLLENNGSYPKNWDRNTTELVAAENLFEERGLVEVENALSWYQDLKDREYCPDVSSPYGLDSKWSKFERFVEKQEV